MIEEGDAEEAVEIEFGEAFGQAEEDLAAEKEDEARQLEERKKRGEKVAAIMAQDLTAASTT